MKRILLGAVSHLPALFAAGMDHAWQRPTYARQYGARRQVRAAFKLTGRPTDKRHWHDRTEFYQSNALEAAVLKRRRRAVKLHNNTDRSLYGNPALRNGLPNLSHQEFSPLITERLNPFYVAK